MTRGKAAAIHLGISALVAAAVIGLMLMLWYPPPYFEAMGGETLLMLIVGCDVIIGPLITLIIFKPHKKGLKTDLTIIGCVQVAALAYGRCRSQSKTPAPARRPQLRGRPSIAAFALACRETRSGARLSTAERTQSKHVGDRRQGQWQDRGNCSDQPLVT